MKRKVEIIIKEQKVKNKNKTKIQVQRLTRLQKNDLRLGQQIHLSPAKWSRTERWNITSEEEETTEEGRLFQTCRNSVTKERGLVARWGAKWELQRVPSTHIERVLASAGRASRGAVWENCEREATLWGRVRKGRAKTIFCQGGSKNTQALTHDR